MCSATYNEAQLGVVFEQRRVGLFACVADRVLQMRKEKIAMVAGYARMTKRSALLWSNTPPYQASSACPARLSVAPY